MHLAPQSQCFGLGSLPISQELALIPVVCGIPSLPVLLCRGVGKGWIGLSWCPYAKKMSHKGHPALECLAKMYVEFQWGTLWGNKERKRKSLMLIFLAFAACSAALPRAGLAVWTVNRERDSAQLNLFRGCLLSSPTTKCKGRGEMRRG